MDEFFSRLRGSHHELANSFSRQQEAQQASSRNRPTTATKGAKPPAKKRQALPPGKSRGETIVIIINKVNQLVNPYIKKKKHGVWMIMYTGPFGYDGAAPLIL